ncbi:recombinase family protein [Rhodococcus sp. 14-2470-1a]|uniref:recombinase family protein n=1 Tax=Rhodococcus sp. 14-2470-1a TaxID=2023150 RepID=UPI000B9B8256|nr:recombinase family protein [Rhodococcus sp. 14-2470-1a]OZF44281.1 recombinase [Rhodococcus sp. 14-2470-1a]
MQVVVYSRISKDRTGAGLGVERQRADCRELVRKLGWTVVAEFTDNDISAYSGRRRPGYEAMLDAVRSGQAQAIVAWHPDRLHRRPIELESFIDVCEQFHVDIRTVHAGTMDLSTASGKMLARMLGAAARHEVEHSIERQKRAKQQAAVEGKFRGGRRSFGYEPDGMTLRTGEAAAIREAATRLLAGVSLSQIAREWNEAGLRTAFFGKEFTSRDVKKVVLRPRNAGHVLHEGQRVGFGKWETIFDPDTLAALDSLLTDPARRNADSFERKYQGSGVYVCGKCGETMLTATQTGGRAGRAKTYKCRGGAHLGRVAGPLDDYVSTLVIGRLSAPDAAILRGGDDASIDVEGLKSKRVGLQARMDELAELFSAGDIDASQLRAGTAKMRLDLDAIEAEMAAARRSSVLANLVLGSDDIAEAWTALSADVRGKIIDQLMVVTLLPAPRGRRPGGGYFDPEFVRIDWRE